MKTFRITSTPVFHLFFPHNCVGCGSDILSEENFLCLACINDLPHTHFALHANNPVEKIFWGRILVVNAMSELYFTKASIVQNVIHEFKYQGNKKIGMYLGNIMGKSILNCDRFKNIDFLIPLPLFEKKEKSRGYNQAEILCFGISEITNIPVLSRIVIREKSTETQTKKGRSERWLNVNTSFTLLDQNILTGKHILLVDDVLTTGATLEACASEILNISGTRVSIATLAMATH